MKKIILLLTIIWFIAGCKMSDKETHARVEKIPEVEKLLKQMTLEEKVGQMAQLTIDVVTKGENRYHTAEPASIDIDSLRKALVDYHVGSILNTPGGKARTTEEWHAMISTIQNVAMNETRLGIPVLYGVDAIHGTTYTKGATFFPQQIGQAATFNRDLVRKAAQITAYETRASATPWTFSPVLDMGRDARYARMWETFGEDVYLVSQLGIEMIKGYEGDSNQNISTMHVASCPKHFLGYGTSNSGKDRTPAFIPDMELYERHVPAFEQAIKSGAKSIMVNSGIINGVSVHASHKLLTGLLKEELGFDGFVITDWMDIVNLYTRDHIAKSHKEAIKLAINAGIDMAMIPYDLEFCDYLVELVNEGQVSTERIDDAVRRILNVKHKLNLWETPLTHYSDYPKFGSKEFQNQALKTALESITLLKNNNNTLPLQNNARILVAGPNANSIRTLNGGWTYTWQGTNDSFYTENYSTILDALEEKAGKQNVRFVQGVQYTENAPYWVDQQIDIQAAVKAAANVDCIVLVLGENSYCEKPGDLHDLSLSENQVELAKALAKTNKPLVLILNQGRPRIIREIEPLADAILNIYLPGNYGGIALSEILYGDYNPNGKLPFTYPLFVNSLVTYDHKPSENRNRVEGMYDYGSDFVIQYPFGYGLSYTTFEYSNLTLSDSTLTKNNEITVSVDIKNTGKYMGKEAILLYTSDVYASVTPDIRRLRAFEKISLDAGQQKTVTFTITPDDISFVNENIERVTEAGEFKVQVANLSQSFSYVE